jgi:SAM-dependent methyltransferase
VPPGARVLDAGSGSAPYQPLFDHARYESADFHQADRPYAPATHVCDLSAIPVEGSWFDYVVFNQVMEHLSDPGAVLDELFRVLRPGGKMIYSGPLFFEEHEVPYDFYRYTQYGLRHLFGRAGFEIERLDWLEGYFGTVGYQLNRMARYLPLRPRALGGGAAGVALTPVMALAKALFAGSSVAFHHLETRAKFVGAGYPKNYVAIVAKPGLGG